MAFLCGFSAQQVVRPLNALHQQVRSQDNAVALRRVIAAVAAQGAG
jgi:hypothetical protein